MKSSVLVAMLIATAGPAAAANTGLSLAEMNAANVSSLDLGRNLSPVWSQQRFMSWVDDGALMVAEAPKFIPTKIVARGEDASVVSVFPARDGHSLLFVRERRGAQTLREMLHMDLDNPAATTLVASGAEIPLNPAFAPEGNRIAFVKDKALRELRSDGVGEWRSRALTLPDARHVAGESIDSVVYSPDATRIAYVSRRKAGQSYIAIVDPEKSDTRYIEPGIFQDHSPVWSPDGSELAFIREVRNVTMGHRFAPQLEGAPWSIVAVNVKSGVLRTIWKADKGLGSVGRAQRGPLVYFRPVWTRDGNILFLWERTGWQLLYTVPANGGPAALLSPGEGEVGEFVVSPDGRSLVFTWNAGDLGRRHLWSVPLPYGKPVQLTKGQGVETSPRFSAGGYLSYLSQNRLDGPPQIRVRDPKGNEHALDRHSPEKTKRFQSAWQQFAPAQVVTARASDGFVSYHVLMKPTTAPPPKGYPVIVHAHGGPDMQTVPGDGYAYSFSQYALQQGYLVLDINYRGSTGFGLRYRLAEDRGALGGGEVKDLAAAVAYLKSRGDVNGNRIALMGESYGGHIVGLGMTQLADDFAAGVSLFGLADWVVEMKKDREADGSFKDPFQYYRLSDRVRMEDLAHDSSPSAHIDRWRAPTLFTIGDLDVNGHMEAVIDLGSQLLDLGVPVEVYVDPAGRHDVFPQERVFEFIEKILRK